MRNSIKADWRNPRDDGRDYSETLFVKTRAYERVVAQEVYFIIGRKGSGKTTLKDVIPQRHKYLGGIAVEAEKFKLEGLYNLFSMDQIRSDVTQIFSKVDVFSFAWEAFLIASCFTALLSESCQSELTPYQKRQLRLIRQFVAKLPGYDFSTRVLDQNALFYFCLDAATRFVEECIAKSRPDPKYFFADMQARFNRANFLGAVFSKQTLDAFYSILKTIHGQFLVSLDGFDSAFDEFRRESIQRRVDLEPRASFEIDWLRAFVRLVLRMKLNPEDATPLYSRLDLCATIPEDRFWEVRTTERDSFRFLGRFQPLWWSGIELAMLLLKRLEELVQDSTRSEERRAPEERLEELLKKHLKHIPLDVSFTFNNKQYQMPLFMYVLRHTFWRPREILLYYAQILAVAQAMKRKRETVTTEILRDIIKHETRQIIHTEFIDEFESTVINIEEILSAFERQSQVLTCSEVSEILRDVDFRFATGVHGALNVNHKIDFLCRIGFLGIQADSRMMKRLSLINRHAFYFNTGHDPIDVVGKDGFKDYTFVIHPIFSEYLDLDTSKNELVLQFSWRELHELEVRRV